MVCESFVVQSEIFTLVLEHYISALTRMSNYLLICILIRRKLADIARYTVTRITKCLNARKYIR